MLFPNQEYESCISLLVTISLVPDPFTSANPYLLSAEELCLPMLFPSTDELVVIPKADNPNH